MKKEYLIVLVIGFLILGYILDAVVNPLALDLATPYHFLVLENFTTYPFTSTSILLKALAVLIIPLVVLGALGIKRVAQAITILVVSALLQLYALQDVASGAQAIPLEWSIGFTVAGLLMVIPMTILALASLIYKDEDSNSPTDHNLPK